ncbi:ObirCsp12 [Ooceraea biroi]|uniref:ObirCsp12 n=1 Tax=Ooceraea biroi TaxID=2015173 RepID=A0A026WAW0_OOCBI|nr:ejaculatory bulb-specific protein 3 [Ooceraea biroi]EZA53190.1 hypothetical protein X777_06269 [Ooceraea biroi]RLU22469.1 ObirCsp12 [Ooceraea biroi]
MVRLSTIVVIIGIALVCTYAQEELYDNKYDDMDVIAIMVNDKLRNQYYKCFMETGPCATGDAKFFKEIFAEALQSKCKRCTEKQKKMLDDIVGWYTENKPAEWQTIVEKSIEDLKKKNAGK